VDRCNEKGIPSGWWFYGQFDNGVKIPRSTRLLYRDRRDLAQKFPDPFRTGHGSFFEWLQQNGQLSA
jgi:hypothetical protein